MTTREQRIAEAVERVVESDYLLALRAKVRAALAADITAAVLAAMQEPSGKALEDANRALLVAINEYGDARAHHGERPANEAVCRAKDAVDRARYALLAAMAEPEEVPEGLAAEVRAAICAFKVAQASREGFPPAGQAHAESAWHGLSVAMQRLHAVVPGKVVQG